MKTNFVFSLYLKFMFGSSFKTSNLNFKFKNFKIVFGCKLKTYRRRLNLGLVKKILSYFLLAIFSCKGFINNLNRRKSTLYICSNQCRIKCDIIIKVIIYYSRTKRNNCPIININSKMIN